MPPKRNYNLSYFSYAREPEETSLKDIYDQVIAAVEKQDITVALEQGGYAAVHNGAAGLFVHHLASLAHLARQAAEQGPLQIPATRCLAKLLACRSIINDNSEEMARLQELLPDHDLLDDEFWQKKTDELAVMVDTFKPLMVTEEAMKIDDGKYYKSWVEE